MSVVVDADVDRGADVDVREVVDADVDVGVGVDVSVDADVDVGVDAGVDVCMWVWMWMRVWMCVPSRLESFALALCIGWVCLVLCPSPCHSWIT